MGCVFSIMKLTIVFVALYGSRFSLVLVQVNITLSVANFKLVVALGLNPKVAWVSQKIFNTDTLWLRGLETSMTRSSP